MIRTVKNLFSNSAAQGAIGTAANVASGVPFGPALTGAAFGVGGIGLAGKALNFLPAPFKIPVMIGLGVLGYQPLNKMGQNIAGNFSNVMNLNLFSDAGQTPQTTSDAAATVSANVQAAPTPSLTRTQNLGPTPEAETNVIVTAGQQQQPRNVPANMNPVANNIPVISSSNPDNFYVYYSMANYNVVT